MFKVNNRNTRARLEICSKLTKETRTTSLTSFGVFIVNLEHISLCFSVSAVNFEQVNAFWEIKFTKNNSYIFINSKSSIS